MSELQTIKEVLAHQKERLHAQYSVRRIGVFGSYARGQGREGSDIDVLVEFDEVPDLIDFIRLRNELIELLGREVDLISTGGLKGSHRREILDDAAFV